MSTSDHRSRQVTYSRSQSRKRKAVLNVDLNVAPPVDNRDQVGPSRLTGPQDCVNIRGVAPSMPPTPIDLEAVDDDVIISSPRAFAEAINNSRRNQGRPVVVDVDSEERPPRTYQTKRRRIPSSQNAMHPNFFINLEVSSNSVPFVSAPPPPPPPPKEVTFNCPVCMGPLVEEMSTKCGHIFCKACIKAAISAQNKCPTCRRRVTLKDIIRVYLPAAS